ncbi:MAG: 1-deoxy-D-xylulose-5-phosphate reductoisomerase [Candidatus Omnitrophota bacterium]|nr:1-deoxy-D-xylulose-5-phosphate reductoisomerase [Candidatus Omnitrophota bacterium]
MKQIAILGSTGSIGQNALEVVRHFPDKFSVVALSANSNIGLLLRQAEEFRPRYVCVGDASAAQKLNSAFAGKIKVFAGSQGLQAIVGERKIEQVLLAISGSAALLPLLAAIDSRKQIALANKEALVMAGPIIMRRAREREVEIIPVDSEQSAIWQCLQGRPGEKLKQVYLTASGGPFLKAAAGALRDISVAKVIRHPRWKMGRKISVDSATMMNKGLEVLEAMFLFRLPPERIKVLIHPQALVHSMVEFVDGVVLAQLSATDMRIPIQYALSYPQRLSNSLPTIDFYKLGALNFSPPDFGKFPCLELAYRAARQLGIAPAVMNAANEACVEEFLKGRLKFTSIPGIIERVMDRQRGKTRVSLTDILEADRWAREAARGLIAKRN